MTAQDAIAQALNELWTEPEDDRDMQHDWRLTSAGPT